MKKIIGPLVLILLIVLLLVLGNCGSDENQLLSRFTGDCPKGVLAFWDCNMTWDQQCWQ